MKASIVIVLLASGRIALAELPPPQAAAVPEAFGYVAIPGAALPPSKTGKSRAIFDATKPAEKPTGLLPALNLAGAQLNGLAAVEAPPSNAQFVVVFHGSSVDGILDDAHYKAKYGIQNPNLKPIAEMKQLGVEFYVCGQYLAANKIDPRTLDPDVTLAADSMIVLMHYQNEGYALMTF